MTDDRGRILTAKRIILFWMLGSFLAGGGLSFLPETHLPALQGLYATFTLSALTLAATLWGIDAAQLVKGPK